MVFGLPYTFDLIARYVKDIIGPNTTSSFVRKIPDTFHSLTGEM